MYVCSCRLHVGQLFHVVIIFIFILWCKIWSEWRLNLIMSYAYEICAKGCDKGMMEAIWDFNSDANFPSTQVPCIDNFDTHVGLGGDDILVVNAPATSWGSKSRGEHAIRRRSTSVANTSQYLLGHKPWSPNWTKDEMLVLVGQKHLEWDDKDNSNQPSLAQFVYGTAAWKSGVGGLHAHNGY